MNERSAILRRFAATEQGKVLLAKIFAMLEQGQDAAPTKLVIKAEEFGGDEDIVLDVPVSDLVLAMKAALGDKEAETEVSQRAERLVANLNL